MAKPHSEALSLIHDIRALFEEQQIFIASDEDCAYFREFARSKSSHPSLSSKQITQRGVSVTQAKTTHLEKRKQPPEPLSLSSSRKDGPSLLETPLNETSAQNKTPLASTHQQNDLSHQRSPSLDNKKEFEEIRSLIKVIAPHLQILEKIPEDREACLIAERWKMATKNTPVVFLFLDEHPLETKLLHNLREALNQQIDETLLIEVRPLEECDHWVSFLSSKELKRIIITESLLKRLPNLLRHYRINPVSSCRFLLNIPVLVLPPLNNYLATPALKRSLWADLKQFITEQR